MKAARKPRNQKEIEELLKRKTYHEPESSDDESLDEMEIDLRTNPEDRETPAQQELRACEQGIEEMEAKARKSDMEWAKMRLQQMKKGWRKGQRR